MNTTNISILIYWYVLVSIGSIGLFPTEGRARGTKG